MSESCQDRNKRMGWGCKCHGETFCPDEIFIGYDDDQPVFARRDSPEGKAAIAATPVPCADNAGLVSRLGGYANEAGAMAAQLHVFGNHAEELKFQQRAHDLREAADALANTVPDPTRATDKSEIAKRLRELLKAYEPFHHEQLNTVLNEAANALDRHDPTRAALVKALMSVEWRGGRRPEIENGLTNYAAMHCPRCCEARVKGHAKDCELASALALAAATDGGGT